MKTLSFSSSIKAPVATVWSTMLDHPTYEQWTAAFSEGSTYTGSRDQGAEIRFVDPSGQGMIAEIAENRLHSFISIHHLGELQIDPKTKKITEYAYDGAGYENYSFSKETDDTTLLAVELTNIPDEYVAMFEEMRPEALAALKTLCEH